MFERFTDRARRVVILAQDEARAMNHNYVGTEHLLLGLIHEGEGVAAKSLGQLGITLEGARSTLEEIIGKGAQAPAGRIPFTARAKRVLELSLPEALQLNHPFIGTEHILLGLVREGEGVGSQVLIKSGVDLNKVRDQVLQMLGTGDRSMQFAGFTDRARRVLILAQDEARAMNHDHVGTEHLLLGLIHEGGGVAAKALDSLGLSLQIVREQVEKTIGQGRVTSTGHIPFTSRAKKVFEFSLREAQELSHCYIDTEHILLGLVREGEGMAAKVLIKLGVDLIRVRDQVLQLLLGSGSQSTQVATMDTSEAGSLPSVSTREEKSGPRLRRNGSDHVTSEYFDFRASVRVLKQMFDVFGTPVLADRVRFLAAIADFMPEFGIERTILRHAVDYGVGALLYRAAGASSDQQEMVCGMAIHTLMDDNGMSQDAAQFAVASLATALDWSFPNVLRRLIESPTSTETPA